MAYLAQNPKDTDEEKTGMNVAAPVASQPSQMAPESLNTQNSAQSGISPQSSQQTAQTSQNKPKTASSGMFTDFRKYIGANSGAGQKMGSAVTKDLGKQAQQVSQQVEKQQQQYQSQIAQQRAEKQAAESQARSTIQKALNIGTESQPQDVKLTEQTPSAQDVQSFRDLVTGKTRFDQPGEFNLASQQNLADRLKNRANALESFQGRSGVLRDIFGKQGRYTRGQGTLDSLLLQRNLGQLTQQGQDISQSAQEGITSARRQAAQQLGGLRQEGEDLRKQLQSDIEGRVSESTQQIQDVVDKEMQERQNYLNQLNEAVNEATQYLSPSVNVSDEQMRDMLANEYVNAELQNLQKIAPLRQYSESDIENRKRHFQQIADNIRQGKHVEYSDTSANLDNIVRNVLGKMGLSDERRLQMLGYDPNQFNTFKRGSNTVQDLYAGDNAMTYLSSPAHGSVASFLKSVRDKARAFNPKDIMEREFIKLGTGTSYEDFLSGADVTAEGLATQEQRARQRALESLAGTQAENRLLAADQLSRTISTASEQDLVNKLLDRFRQSNQIKKIEV